ncbi:Protein inturned, partial [Acropora cervicornis]
IINKTRMHPQLAKETPSSLSRYEEPPWAGHIKEKGDVFYIEPFVEPSTNDLQDSMEQLDISENGQNDKDKNKHSLRSLNSVKKIIPGLSKRDRNEDKVNSEKISKCSASQGIVEGLNNVNKVASSVFKRDVQLIVVPPKNHSGSKNNIETLLGIIPGRDKAGKLSQNDSYSGSRLFIKGFIPDGPALRTGELRIGDVLLSLNKLDLNSSNVHTILAAITGPMEITLTIQRVIEPKLSSPTIHYSAPPKNDSHLIKLISGDLPVLSKLDLKNVPHVALYLTITSSEDDSLPDQDILYQFPKSESASKLVSLRGMFLTLSDLMSSVTGSSANSSTLVLDKKLVHVVYSKVSRDVLVIAMPAERIPLALLRKISDDVTQILSIMYGSMQRAFGDKVYKAQLDHLFSLLFNKALAHPPKENGKENFINKLCDLVPGVQWLNLPLSAEISLHCCLNDLEAADYGEFVDDYFQIRRLYTILGSSIFYKGYLVSNHLPREDLEDIVLYCKYHCLLAMSAEQRVGQLVVWREVFPTRKQGVSSENKTLKDTDYREPTARYFLLIVGRKHWLMCVLLEAGGISKKTEGHPPPNAYYVDQVKNTLHQIESMDIPSVCEACTESLTTQKKYGSLDNLRFQDEADLNDSGTGPSTLRRRGSDSSGSLGGSLSRLRSLRSQFSLNTAGTFRKSLAENIPDLSQLVNTKVTSGAENTLFHYLSWDSFHGIVVCPRDGDTPSPGATVHAEVVSTFHKTCLSMRRLFSSYYKQRLKKKDEKARFACSGMEGVVEHGVQFHRTPDKAAEQKKASAVLKYWVIGRLFPGDHPHELYVCHHSSVPQSTVELAFKLGFGV